MDGKGGRLINTPLSPLSREMYNFSLLKSTRAE